jgi:hypothetical protein
MSQAATAIDDLSQTEFRVGRIISRTSSVYFSHFISFTLIGVIVYAPLFLFIILVPATTREGQAIQSLVSLFFYLFISPLATAIIVHAAFQHMRGGEFSLTASVATGLRRLLPLIALSILWGLGVWLGFVLLIVPGLILLVMWCVIVPCCVVERTGPIRSFGRSRELTKGVRWKLFGLFLLVFLIAMVLSIASSALFGAFTNVFDIQQFQIQQQQLQASWAYMAYSLIFAGIYLAFFSILVVVIYYYLRQYKEGADIYAIASVFD